MKRIPARPDLGHLKKQAKELLAFYRANDPTATIRFRDALPAAAGKSDAAIASLGLRLHDAQSCIAREYGFASWADLQGFVLARRAQADDPANTVLHWLRCVYAGDIAGGTDRSRPSVAVRLLILTWPAPSATKPLCARRRRKTRAGSVGRAARSSCRPWSLSRIPVC